MESFGRSLVGYLLLGMSGVFYRVVAGHGDNRHSGSLELPGWITI